MTFQEWWDKNGAQRDDPTGVAYWAAYDAWHAALAQQVNDKISATSNKKIDLQNFIKRRIILFIN